MRNVDPVELRFPFGKNWTNFLSSMNEDRISEAMKRLSESIGDLRGRSFLDVGSGSGIHSLAAIRLGASRVHSFDYDAQSVACTLEMKKRYAREANWHIEQGSVLDASYIGSLGKFDTVYSWGVLHHTGDMWRALDLVALPVEKKLMIAIYHDQGWKSRFWKAYKRAYNKRRGPGKRLMELMVFGWAWGKPFVLHPGATKLRWTNYIKDRGMSPWYDVVDWAGGYPYEVATPDQLISFFEQRGLTLDKLNATYGGGNNELIFTKRGVNTR